MRPRRLAEVALAVEGTLEGEDVEVRSVTTDSRDMAAGALFVALPGEHTDGHRFVDRGVRRRRGGGDGRRATASATSTAGPWCAVGSTAEALMRSAADERTSMTATVVGVTGANGKTSTKDLTRGGRADTDPRPREPGVVQQRDRAAADPARRAARHGGPRRRDGRAAAGDVRLLSEVARPHIVVVTNVGVAHMEVFGSWASIVEASAEPIDALGPDGRRGPERGRSRRRRLRGRGAAGRVRDLRDSPRRRRASPRRRARARRAGVVRAHRRGRRGRGDAGRAGRAHGVERAGRRGRRPRAGHPARGGRPPRSRRRACPAGGWRRSRRRTGSVS